MLNINWQDQREITALPTAINLLPASQHLDVCVCEWVSVSVHSFIHLQDKKCEWRGRWVDGWMTGESVECLLPPCISVIAGDNVVYRRGSCSSCDSSSFCVTKHTHTHTLQGGLTAALIASWHHCNNSASFSEMIIGENPWLLSQVHYIMPASQSASRPPSTLCYVSPLWQPAVIFFYFSGRASQCQPHEIYTLYTPRMLPHQALTTPRNIPISPELWR